MIGYYNVVMHVIFSDLRRCLSLHDRFDVPDDILTKVFNEKRSPKPFKQWTFGMYVKYHLFIVTTIESFKRKLIDGGIKLENASYYKTVI